MARVPLCCERSSWLQELVFVTVSRLAVVGIGAYCVDLVLIVLTWPRLSLAVVVLKMSPEDEETGTSCRTWGCVFCGFPRYLFVCRRRHSRRPHPKARARSVVSRPAFPIGPPAFARGRVPVTVSSRPQVFRASAAVSTAPQPPRRPPPSPPHAHTRTSLPCLRIPLAHR